MAEAVPVSSSAEPMPLAIPTMMLPTMTTGSASATPIQNFAVFDIPFGGGCWGYGDQPGGRGPMGGPMKGGPVGGPGGRRAGGPGGGPGGGSDTEVPSCQCIGDAGGPEQGEEDQVGDDQAGVAEVAARTEQSVPSRPHVAGDREDREEQQCHGAEHERDQGDGGEDAEPKRVERRLNRRAGPIRSGPRAGG